MTELKKEKSAEQMLLSKCLYFRLYFKKAPARSKPSSFLTATGALWCLFLCACEKFDACARCGLRSRNTLHYSFGWQSRGPYPLALPHHSTRLHAATAAASLHARPGHHANLQEDYQLISTWDKTFGCTYIYALSFNNTRQLLT